MDNYLFVFLLLFPSVYGSVCVPYNFEDQFEDFNPAWGPVCETVNNNWSLRQYSSVSFILPPHPQSESCITAMSPISCVSSFFFDMEGGGIIEVDLYVVFLEFLTITIYNEDGLSISSWTSTSNPIAANEWQTIRFTVTTMNPFSGYLSLFATVSLSDTIFIDSFRYIPPGQDPNDIECALYTDVEEITSTTEALTTENEVTTDALTTENEVTTEALTTENEFTTDALTTDNDVTPEAATTENGGNTEDNSTTEGFTTDNVTTETESGSFTTEAETSNTDDSTGSDVTTDSTTEDDSEVDTTDSPGLDSDDDSSFWTVLTITLVAIASFLALIIIIGVSYWCGTRRAKEKVPEILYLDIDELPSTIVVPRVKKMYTDSVSNSNPYAREY